MSPTPEPTDTAHTDRADAGPARRGRVFDIRTVIAGVFVVYGVLIGGAGIAPDAAGLVKSQGVDINLWTGLAMLVVGLLFGLWQRLRPLSA